MRLVLLEWHKKFGKKYYNHDPKSSAMAFNKSLVDLAIEIKVRGIKFDDLDRRLKQLVQKNMFELKKRQQGKFSNFQGP